MRISDWSSDVCSSDLQAVEQEAPQVAYPAQRVVELVDVLVQRPADPAGLRTGLVHHRRILFAQARHLAVHIAQRRFLAAPRSAERRDGKECVRTCRSRWSPYHAKKTKLKDHII